MISMNLIRRASAVTAATAMAALITVAASACGGATTATGATTNGLEKKPAAEVLQEAAAALKAAKSVHLVATSADGHFDFRMQDGSTTGTLTRAGAEIRITIIGRDGYAKTDRAGLKMIGVPRRVQRHDAGRWLKIPARGFTGLTIADFASGLTTYYGALVPKVRQATLNGRKVVVVSWRNGSQLHVANTGPAYPLRAEFKAQHPALIEFSEYGAPLHITAPRNAIDLSNAG
jgi:hypothetical protein